MSTISINASQVSSTRWFHLYLTYEDGLGGVKIIEGGVVPDASLIDFTLGRTPLLTRIDVVSKEEIVSRSGDPKSVLDLNGRDPDIVWDQMVQQATAIKNANIPYDIDLIFGESDNSNSLVASVLNAVGINVLNVLPGNRSVDLFPGVEDQFSEYKNLLNVTLTGSEKADILHGGLGNDNVTGGGGNDAIFGGAGNDILNGSSGQSVNNEVDGLVGGKGSDTFVINNYYGKAKDEIVSNGNGERLSLSIKPKDYAIIADFNPLEGDVIIAAKGKSNSATTVENYLTQKISNKDVFFGYDKYTVYGVGTFDGNAYSYGIFDDVNGDGIIRGGDQLIAVIAANAPRV